MSITSIRKVVRSHRLCGTAYKHIARELYRSWHLSSGSARTRLSLLYIVDFLEYDIRLRGSMHRPHPWETRVIFAETYVATLLRTWPVAKHSTSQWRDENKLFKPRWFCISLRVPVEQQSWLCVVTQIHRLIFSWQAKTCSHQHSADTSGPRGTLACLPRGSQVVTLSRVTRS